METPELQVQSSVEVLALLQELHQRQISIQLITPDGQHASTVLWSVDRERQTLSLDAQVDANVLRAVQACDELTAVAYLDSIKLQFDLGGLVLVTGDQGAAWSAPLPTRMYRFQRREAFRVQPLSSTHPVVTVSLADDLPSVWQLRVLDLSAGGLGMLLPPDAPPLHIGQRLDDVVMALDRSTRLHLTLQVQYLGPADAPHAGTHVGCAFVKLSGEATRDLQVYIDNTQRKRRLFKKA